MSERVEGELRWYVGTGKRLDPDLKRLRIVPLCDVHYGNPLCSVKHFDRVLAYIDSNEDVYAVLDGDLCESTLRSSKGDIYRQVGTPQDQRDWIIERLYPRRRKMLGATMGNHEDRIYKETGIDISKDIAAALEIPYRPEGILLKVIFGDGNNRTIGKPYVYWVYATHGYGGARTKSAKAVKVERLSTWVDADVYIMAHDHVANAAPDIFLRPDDRASEEKGTGFLWGAIKSKRKLLVKANAFLKWGGYAEMGGFPPSDLESPMIVLAGEGKPKVNVQI